MVDFRKKLDKTTNKKAIDPIEIYESLDRESDKGPLRPVQLAVLAEWHKKRRSEKDVILKLHTGQGKTLIGLLLLQAKLNEGMGPAVYICPNNFLIKQTCQQASQFGIEVCTIDGELPNAFANSKAILVTSVHSFFNGLTKFGLGANFQEVGAVVLDDAHACIDTIQEQVSMRIAKDVGAYGEIVRLFGASLRDQGAGTYADLLRNEYDAILPVPYWEWIEKAADVAAILSRHSDNKNIRFAWPLLKDSIADCQCVIGGDRLEISPHRPPLERFRSFEKASHRVFMSATVTDDSFLVKGLGLSANTILNPLTYDNEKWSGEKMILIPSLIDEDLNREEIVNMFAHKRPTAKFGVVALCPSFNSTRDWESYGAVVAKPENIESRIADLKAGNYQQALVIVNRYDGIDLPDSSCRILIIDSRPYSESVLDRYLERCLGDGDAISLKTARKIEQGLGRSVRGEKDYCVAILIGPDLIKQLRTASKRQYFSAQTKAQIEIGLEIADDAKSEGKKPRDALVELVNQCLRRDVGWKEFYVQRMDAMPKEQPKSHKRLEIFGLELLAERKTESAYYEEAAATIDKLINTHVTDDAERGWYLQQMARLVFRGNKSKSNTLQIAAHKKNRLLLRPREGMVIEKITPLSQKRVDKLIANVKAFGDYENLAIAVDELTSKLAFGVSADTFENALHQLGELMGFACQRPDAEWKEGPDNLWCLRDGQFLLIEAKSEVLETRAHIVKDESNQMDRSIAWFMKTYPNCNCESVLVHPSRNLHKAAAFVNPNVKVMMKSGLENLSRNAKKFFAEFKAVDFKDISPDQVQNALSTHELATSNLLSNYTDTIRTI